MKKHGNAGNKNAKKEAVKGRVMSFRCSEDDYNAIKKLMADTGLGLGDLLLMRQEVAICNN